MEFAYYVLKTTFGWRCKWEYIDANIWHEKIYNEKSICFGITHEIGINTIT